MKICSECKDEMCEGYYIRGHPKNEYYCSEKCLHKHYTPEEWKKMYDEAHDEEHYDGDACYWSTWDDEDEDSEELQGGKH